MTATARPPAAPAQVAIPGPTGHPTPRNRRFVVHLLGLHPEIQEQVAPGGEELAHAAVQEGLRLQPPAYLLGRRVGADGAVVAGYALPPGTDVNTMRPAGPVRIGCHPR